MPELVKLDETTLQAKLIDVEARLEKLESIQMPDDIKQKLKDVLTWLMANL